jgi:hypothetical protein
MAAPAGVMTRSMRRAQEAAELKAADMEDKIGTMVIPSLCTVCHEMYTAAGQRGMCSVCLTKTYADDPAMQSHVLIQRLKGQLKGVRVDWPMDQLDAIFAQSCPGVSILTSSQAGVFIRSYKDKPLDEMLAAYLGLREFPPFVLRAADADRLVDALMPRLEREYRLVHLLAPRVLDRWAMLKHTKLMQCYWPCSSPPIKIERLVDLWSYVSSRWVLS